MPRVRETGRSVSSRLFAVLQAFRPGRSRLTVTDLVRLTGMPQATVSRVVAELVAAGMLQRERDGRLVIGTSLWRLGTLAPLTEPLRTAALPFVEDLHSALDHHIQLAVLEGRQEVVVERRVRPGPPGRRTNIGARLPLHSTAGGKVLLAHGGAELFEALIEHGLGRFTQHTVTDPGRLRSELAACRQTGTATVHSELLQGTDSVATRIMDGEGFVVAALSVVHQSRSLELAAVLPSLIAAGHGISRRLGWHPQIGVRSEPVAR